MVIVLNLGLSLEGGQHEWPMDSKNESSLDIVEPATKGWAQSK